MNNIVLTDKGFIDSKNEPVYIANTDRSVYEVIRLIEGVALFLEDHFDRLLSSARMSGMELNLQLPEFNRLIEALITANNQNTGNIKFLLSAADGIHHWSLSFIPHSYPTDNEYQQGVSAGLLYAERLNPKAKVIQLSVREKANQMIADKKLYEVLLVDRNGLITEGSRSNVFFVKENRFYTAPATMVLSGVTRKKVLECLKELNYPLLEEAVSDRKAGDHDAVFITGTSPKVLPVNAIDGYGFQTDHPMVKQLMDYYNRMIEDYIRSKSGQVI